METSKHSTIALHHPANCLEPQNHVLEKQYEELAAQGSYHKDF